MWSLSKGKRSAALTLALFFTGVVVVQAGHLRGKIVDKNTAEPLVAATVVLKNQADTTRTRYATADKNGAFEIKQIEAGNYHAVYAYLGYKPYSMVIKVDDVVRDLGVVGLEQNAEELDAVEVKATAVRAAQRGDTIDFNASAYKVNTDATTEDLLKKLPGVTVEGGTVKTQGESVKKILVDGKPFFGDDPTIAIRNLPAEVIDRIEVYDQMSDQSQLTGFDDGEGVKAINIVTKPNRRIGQFGRMQAGVGYDDTQNEMRYAASGNLSLFQGQRRVSIIGMSNNVNQQNFAAEDMAALSSSGRGRRGGAFTGSGSGIATTHALGVNYADMWGKKTEVTASYFFNYTDLFDESKTKREYLTGRDSSTMYHALSNRDSRTQNHRMNIRLDHKFNDKTSLLVVPVASVQVRDANNYSADTMVNISLTNNRNVSEVDNFNFSNMMLLRHKFGKPGRTFSAFMFASISDANTYNLIDNYSLFVLDSKEEKRNQQLKNPTNNWSARTNMAYTEPTPDMLWGQGMVQVNYSFNYSFGESNNRAYNLTDAGVLDNLDSIFSNIYANNYYTHRAGLNYMYTSTSKKAKASIGANYEVASLDGTQQLPLVPYPHVSKTFYTVLPMARYEYQFTKQKTLRAFYRSYTNAPSVNQLQSVIDVTNPLLVTAGNPALKQSTNHMLNMSYNQTSIDKGFTFFAMVSGSLANQFIATHTLIAARDTNISPIEADTLWLRRGSQLSIPVNIPGYEYKTLQGALTFGVPVKWIKSNLNLNSNAGYTRRPGMVNYQMNISDNYNLSQGVVLSSNISEKLDFNLGYSATYNITANTLQAGQNNNFFRHNANARINWEFWRGIVLQTTITYDQYRGLAVAYNEEFTRWDASIGKKLLKSQRLELRLSVYDILNQMQNFNRNVTETYIEDVTSITLYRYFMVSAVYNLRSMGTPPKAKQMERPMMRMHW